MDSFVEDNRNSYVCPDQGQRSLLSDSKEECPYGKPEPYETDCASHLAMVKKRPQHSAPESGLPARKERGRMLAHEDLLQKSRQIQRKKQKLASLQKTRS